MNIIQNFQYSGPVAIVHDGRSWPDKISCVRAATCLISLITAHWVVQNDRSGIFSTE